MNFKRRQKSYFERVDHYINNSFGSKCGYLRRLNDKSGGQCPNGCSKWECKNCYPLKGILTHYSRNKTRLLKRSKIPPITPPTTLNLHAGQVIREVINQYGHKDFYSTPITNRMFDDVDDRNDWVTQTV